MLKSTQFMVLQERKRVLPLHRFFIGYWILKRGWIFILALFLFLPVQSSLASDPTIPVKHFAG